MPGQLVFPFGVRPVRARENFVVAPCNEQAFRFIERWPDWPVRIAAIYGPAGCGKTHLAYLWSAASGAAFVAAADLVAEPPSANALVIEDMDAAAASAARDNVLMALFEQPERMLLLTGRAQPAEWPVAVDDLRSRFDSLLAFPMWAPDETLLSRLIRKHFADRQLEVPDAVVKRILTHVERTPEAVADFVARIDHKALSEKRAVTERLVLDVLESDA